MKHSALIRKILIYVARALIAFLIGGTIAVFIASRPSSLLAQTDGGVIFEQLIPADVDFVVSVNPSSAAQQAGYDKIGGALLKDKRDSLLPMAVDEFLKQHDLALSPDEMEKILPATVRFLGAFRNVQEEKSAVTYAFLQVKDISAAQEIAAKQSTKMAVVKDVLIVTDGGESVLNNVRSRAQWPSIRPLNTFAAQRDFNKKLSAVDTPFFGYAYIQWLPFQEGTNQNWGSNFAALIAEENGARVTYVTDNSAKTTLPPTLNFYKKLPSDGEIIYSESWDVGSKVSEFIEKSEGKKDPFVALGVKFEEDLRPFLGKNFSFSMQDVGDVLPSVSVFADASDAPQKATEFVKKVTNLVKPLVSLANSGLQKDDQTKASKETEILSITETATGKITATTILFYPQRVPKEIAAIPLFEAYKNPFELSFGLTDTNIFFISTVPGITVSLLNPQTLTNELFKQGEKGFFADAQAIGVVSTSGLRRFVNAFAGTVARLEGGEISEEQKGQLAFMDGVLAPLKGALFATHILGNFSVVDMIVTLNEGA